MSDYKDSKSPASHLSRRPQRAFSISWGVVLPTLFFLALRTSLGKAVHSQTLSRLWCIRTLSRSRARVLPTLALQAPGIYLNMGTCALKSDAIGAANAVVNDEVPTRRG